MGKPINRLAIVRSRLASSRLPAKILKKVAGREILGHVLDRLAACQNLDGIVVATTVNPGDDRIVGYLADDARVGVFRGSEDNVLDRTYRAAEAFKADLVVRVTSDSPLIDPALVDYVVTVAQDGGYDYVSNSLRPTMPDGLDVECFRFHALAMAWQQAGRPEEREHVTPYMRMHPDLFRLANVSIAQRLESFCWAVDTPEDLNFVQALADRLDLTLPSNHAFETVLAVLAAHPELAAINSGSVRDHKLTQQLPGIFSDHAGRFDDHCFGSRTDR